MQGLPLTDIPLESFTLPIATYTCTNFLTGRAAVRRMVQKETPGVILMHTPEPARLGVPLLGGMAPAWAALESLCRSFSAEFATRGIRALCLRTTGLPEIKLSRSFSGSTPRCWALIGSRLVIRWRAPPTPGVHRRWMNLLTRPHSWPRISQRD